MKTAILRSLTLLLILTLGLSYARGQKQPLSIITVDRETYALWQSKDWDALAAKGNEALREGIDFYYLRVRMGIAYYQKRNYHAAIPHFERAFKLTPNETYIAEYLYYSYLFSGREFEARLLASSLPPNIRQKLGGVEQKTIDRVNLHYGTTINQDKSPGDGYAISIDPQTDGIQDIPTTLGVLTIGINHWVAPKLSLYHCYTNIQKTSFDYIQTNGTSITLPNQEASVHQYYLSGNARVGKNLNLMVGGHLVHIRYPVEETVFRQGRTTTVTRTETINEGVGFVSTYQNLRYLTLGATLIVGNLNNSTQVQGNLSASVFPLGNLNLYSSAKFSIQRDFYNDNNFTNRYVGEVLVGGKLIKPLWAEISVASGDMRNHVGNNGLSVFNGAGSIKHRLGASLIAIITPKVRGILSYTNMANATRFVDGTTPSVAYNEIEHTYHSLTGGILWNF